MAMDGSTVGKLDEDHEHHSGKALVNIFGPILQSPPEFRAFLNHTENGSGRCSRALIEIGNGVADKTELRMPFSRSSHSFERRWTGFFAEADKIMTGDLYTEWRYMRSHWATAG